MALGVPRRGDQPEGAVVEEVEGAGERAVRRAVAFDVDEGHPAGVWEVGRHVTLQHP